VLSHHLTKSLQKRECGLGLQDFYAMQKYEKIKMHPASLTKIVLNVLYDQGRMILVFQLSPRSFPLLMRMEMSEKKSHCN
jgi:hypothetical protein